MNEMAYTGLTYQERWRDLARRNLGNRPGNNLKAEYFQEMVPILIQHMIHMCGIDRSEKIN